LPSFGVNTMIINRLIVTNGGWGVAVGKVVGFNFLRSDKATRSYQISFPRLIK